MALPQIGSDYYKFCPGEERIKLSNAVCRGRRRANFPKCPGCQFNDDELAAPSTDRADRARDVEQLDSLFRDQDILGEFPVPLSENAAWRIGHAAAQFLHGRLRGLDRASHRARTVVVGRDLRPASRSLLAPLIEGIRSVGLDVTDLGCVDTPILYFAVQNLRACGGIQVTGGVMPDSCSGFKLCGDRATPIADATGLAGIHDIALRVPPHQTGMTGTVTTLDMIPPYRDFIRQALPTDGFQRPLLILVDADGGVAEKTLPGILEGVRNLTLQFVESTRADASTQSLDAITAGNDLCRQVKLRKADIGIRFTPDADRCAFVDDKGVRVLPDHVAALIARRLLERHRAAAVVLDVRVGLAAQEEIERAGGVALREKVGYFPMRKRMIETNALFGADLSGRFYFGQLAGCESPLLSIANLLSLIAESGRKLSELLKPLQRFKTSGEVALACDQPDLAIQRLADQHAQARISRFDGLTVRYEDWGFHLRSLDQQLVLHVTLEARTQKLVDQRLCELSDCLDEITRSA